jgi:hypothetical protein
MNIQLRTQSNSYNAIYCLILESNSPEPVIQALSPSLTTSVSIPLRKPPIWEKEISNVFTLVEYPIANEPHCLIIGGDRSGANWAKILSIFFQDWGLDRETITNLQCSIVFQAVLEVGIVDEMSGFSFKDALAWASD